MFERNTYISDRDAMYKGEPPPKPAAPPAALWSPLLMQAWFEVLTGVRAPWTLDLSPSGVTLQPWWVGVHG